jgi:hypothetical protein
VGINIRIYLHISPSAMLKEKSMLSYCFSNI